MTPFARRIVTGHDESGKSIVVHDAVRSIHSMRGPSVGADFNEIWNVPLAVPLLTSVEAGTSPTSAISRSCRGASAAHPRIYATEGGRQAYGHAPHADARLCRDDLRESSCCCSTTAKSR